MTRWSEFLTPANKKDREDIFTLKIECGTGRRPAPARAKVKNKSNKII